MHYDLAGEGCGSSRGMSGPTFLGWIDHEKPRVLARSTEREAKQSGLPGGSSFMWRSGLM